MQQQHVNRLCSSSSNRSLRSPFGLPEPSTTGDTVLRGRSFLLKVVEVDLLDRVGLLFSNANVVVDHELGQLLAVDENYLLLDATKRRYVRPERAVTW